MALTGRFEGSAADPPSDAPVRVRTAVPTLDRPGSLPLCLLTLALHLPSDSELVIYDAGTVAASREYGTRFALDLAVKRGLRVTIEKTGRTGIHMARAQMLRDAQAAGIARLLMVDDDIILPATEFSKLQVALDKSSIVYAVPVIRLANNEAGVGEYDDPDPTKPENQQYVVGRSGTKLVVGAAWTCAILFDLRRFDVPAAIERLVNGPPVVEDYTLTQSLEGEIVQHAEVWHCMTPDQGDRGWEGRALAYMRQQIGTRGKLRR